MSNLRKKVLLMGKSGSGKTSMRSIIFANYRPGDTTRLGVTMDVEHTHLRIGGNLVLNLWDCGGQHGFMESYFTNQKENIFRNVEVLIYVFDIVQMDSKDDKDYYESCIRAIKEYSPKAKIFCLLHKIDLIMPTEKIRFIEMQKETLQEISSEVRYFATTIWNETLYEAWSKIVYNLIPNVEKLEKSLKQFSDILMADDIILFERATFLQIASHRNSRDREDYKIDKISELIKRFKQSCSKHECSFTGIQIRNDHFSAYLDQFTSSTYIMVIISDSSICELILTYNLQNFCLASVSTLLNIQNAKRHFEGLEKLNQKHSAIGFDR
ncbi:hypothetical protein Ciccas_004973 [Cichlidogyrus casuarinus]|uniref:GTP-binding protein n=1 Tax=Cichlidogyrus casuarinus TaxID=1844966 RepID=A0ABD2Q9Y5_9PLAT